MFRFISLTLLALLCLTSFSAPASAQPAYFGGITVEYVPISARTFYEHTPLIDLARNAGLSMSEHDGELMVDPVVRATYTDDGVNYAVVADYRFDQEVALIHFPAPVTDDEAEAWMHARGLEPGDLRDLLVFRTQQPRFFHEYRSVIALGNPTPTTSVPDIRFYFSIRTGDEDHTYLDNMFTSSPKRYLERYYFLAKPAVR